jgi:hypothetical protein
MKHSDIKNLSEIIHFKRIAQRKTGALNALAACR